MYKAKLAAAGVLKSLPDASFAAAQLPCHKDEDRFFVHDVPIPGACDVLAGVFDGHGGKSSSLYCEKNFARVLEEELEKLTFDGDDFNAMAANMATPKVGSRADEGEFGSKVTDRYGLLDGSEDLLSPTSKQAAGVWHPKLDEALTATFNRLDKEVNETCTGGAAAIVVLFKKRGTTIHVKSAWAGDSRAIAVSDDGDFELSIDHKPDEERENKRVIHVLTKPPEPPKTIAKRIIAAVTPRSWQAKQTGFNGAPPPPPPPAPARSRFASEAGASQQGTSIDDNVIRTREDDGRTAPNAPAPGSSPSAPPPPAAIPDDDLGGMMMNLTVKTKPKRSSGEDAQSMEEAQRAQSHSSNNIQVAKQGKRSGLSSQYSFYRPAQTKYGVARVVGRSGHGLAVSRSIGDKNASHAVVSDPEFKNAYFKEGQRVRVVIASDGLWDVMESEHAASESFFDYKKTAPGCATHLARTAKLLRYSQYDLFGDDDITALVLDVNNAHSMSAVKKIDASEAISPEKEDEGGGCKCAIM